MAFDTSLADIRNNQVNVATKHDDGVIIDHYKDPASPQFMHMVEETLPDIVAQAVKAALYGKVVEGLIPGLGGEELTGTVTELEVPPVDVPVGD
jgi:hypothetical protein